MKPQVSLQINLAPGDYLHARYILPHQLKILSKQVNEIILTVDTKPSKGRFSEGWNEYKELLNNFLYNELQREYNTRIIPVDYSRPIKSEIADYFFGTTHIPEKDFRGGPFYAYFFGLYHAINNIIFHLDSDMFLGGRSGAWIDEAVDFFKSEPECLIVSPLPGPPHSDDLLIGQSVKNKIAPYTYELDGMSTRIFMIDKSIIKKHKLTLKKPGFRNQAKAIIQKTTNADLPEHIISTFMKDHHFKRFDFLGAKPGMWSLHPPYHTKTFYDNLQTLIANVESGNLPGSQNGFYDIIDEVCDWSEAGNYRWWKNIAAKY